MSNSEISQSFILALKKNGIRTDYDPVLDDYKLVSQNVPSEENLIEIPDEEIFPMPSVETNIPHYSSHQLVSCAYKEVLDNFQNSKEKSSDTVQKDNLKSMMPIQDPEEFVKFKQEYNTYVAKTCESYDFETPASLCSVPTCLNTAIPTFDYCICHIEMDPKFEALGLLKKCENEDCEIPTSMKFGLCTFHRTKKNQKK